MSYKIEWVKPSVFEDSYRINMLCSISKRTFIFSRFLQPLLDFDYGEDKEKGITWYIHSNINGHFYNIRNCLPHYAFWDICIPINMADLEKTFNQYMNIDNERIRN